MSSPIRHHNNRGPEQLQTGGVASTLSLHQNTTSGDDAVNEALDRKFYTMMMEIDKRYQADTKLQKHEKIRIEQWVSVQP